MQLETKKDNHAISFFDSDNNIYKQANFIRQIPVTLT